MEGLLCDAVEDDVALACDDAFRRKGLDEDIVCRWVQDREATDMEGKPWS